MFDVSPVYRAAYDATSVNVDTRGLDKMKADERKELEEYYKQLKEEIRWSAFTVMQNWYGKVIGIMKKVM